MKRGPTFVMFILTRLSVKVKLGNLSEQMANKAVLNSIKYAFLYNNGGTYGY
jgi:hypothetical protein